MVRAPSETKIGKKTPSKYYQKVESIKKTQGIRRGEKRKIKDFKRVRRLFRGEILQIEFNGSSVLLDHVVFPVKGILSVWGQLIFFSILFYYA